MGSREKQRVPVSFPECVKRRKPSYNSLTFREQIVKQGKAIIAESEEECFPGETKKAPKTMTDAKIEPLIIRKDGNAVSDLAEFFKIAVKLSDAACFQFSA